MIVTLVCLPLDVAGVPTRVIPDACGGAWERATLTVVRLALAPNVEVSVPVGPLAPSVAAASPVESLAVELTWAASAVPVGAVQVFPENVPNAPWNTSSWSLA